MIILTKYYENWEIIKKGVPQTAQISKLEWISSKFPSQLEIGGEQLFWGTAREVLFMSAEQPRDKSDNKPFFSYIKRQFRLKMVTSSKYVTVFKMYF